MKLLFISHDASRTGAPKIGLYILQWLKLNRKDVLVDTVLLEGGEIQDIFEGLSNRIYYYNTIGNTKKAMNKWLVKVLNKIGSGPTTNRQKFFNEIIATDYDVIYANSVVSLPVAHAIKNKLPNSKLMLHVHELENVISMYFTNFKTYLDKVDGYIAASNLVKENLVSKHNVNPKLVDVIYEFSQIENVNNDSKKSDVFRVGASGALNLRKGFDIFIQVAIYIKTKHPDSKIEFVWVGSTHNKNLLNMAKSDMEKSGLKDVVHFTGLQESPTTYYNNFDVFLMTSREDPFPLVCIEMAHLEKPIICFRGATGTEELLTRGGGFIVPYLDVEAMVEKTMYYYNHPNILKEDGKKAKQLFANLTPDNMCPLIFSKIELLLKEKN